MAYCPQCGKPAGEKDRFCSTCGGAVAGTDPNSYMDPSIEKVPFFELVKRHRGTQIAFALAAVGLVAAAMISRRETPAPVINVVTPQPQVIQQPAQQPASGSQPPQTDTIQQPQSAQQVPQQQTASPAPA